MRSIPLKRPTAATALTITLTLALAIQSAPARALAQSSKPPPEAVAQPAESTSAAPESAPPPPAEGAPPTPAETASVPSLDDASPPPLDEVIVTGEQPGPGLWKITHGGTNVVWVLGTVGGIPKDVKWHSRQVEAVISQAQEVIFGENVSPNIGLFRGLLLLPTVLKARFNPDKAVLKDMLPPDRYERWLPLRKKYFKDDEDIERVRPMFIALQMGGAALRAAGLNEEGSVARIVAQAAKKSKVPIKVAEVKFDLPDPKQAIRDFTSGTPREKDLGCFNTALDHLESDLEKMKSRASAWAVGDIEAFRKLPAPETRRICVDALTSAPPLQSQFTALKGRVVDTWLWDVEKALELNAVTLVVLPLDDVLSPTGRLARLRERGYTIEAPATGT
jgi:uncharacterized protein YbaP (TraB family)